MKGGRIMVVNKNSYEVTKQTNIVSIGKIGDLGDFYIKTIYDMMADFISLKTGDLIFFWESNSEEKGRGIIGVSEVISFPYFDVEDIKDKNGNVIISGLYPFRVKIRNVIPFNNFLSEYNLFSKPEIRNKIWNLVGKKVGGKARGSIPLTPVECEILIHLLSEINGGLDLKNINNPTSYKYSNVDKMKVFFNDKETINRPKNLKEVNLEELQTITGDRFKYEKILEAWLNENIESDNQDIRNIFGKKEYLGWYANYLPYSLDKKEMDYIVYHSHKNLEILLRISLVELKKDEIDEAAIDQVIKYAEWAFFNLTNGVKTIIQPIIIGKSPKSNNLEKVKKKAETEKQRIGLTRDIWLVEYVIEKNKVILKPINFVPPDVL